MKDYIGMRFGRLVVIEEVEPKKRKDGRLRRIAKCLCDCNESKNIAIDQLGKTKSCGCLLREKLASGNFKHGLRYTKAHKVWTDMLERCRNKNKHNYKNYGGRGIKVCEEWKSVVNFYRDMGEPPTGTTLDRIDVNKGYYKENCRWATPKEQANNTRTNRFIFFKGETKTLSQWCEFLGISKAAVNWRFSRGYPLELVFYKGRIMNGKIQKTPQ